MRRARAATLALAIVVGVVGGAVWAAAGQEPSRTIDCQFAHRTSVTKEVQIGPRVRLSRQRPTVSGRAGAFGFRAATGTEARQVEPGGLSIRVWSRRTGKLAAAALYQFSDTPLNQFHGGHGFTGLVYTYLPRGDELQYFCRAL